MAKRRVVLQMGLSLDGYVVSGHGDDEWGLSGEHEDTTEWKLASLRRAGTHIMGRLTYEAMAAVWPSATGAYAAPMNDIPKVVFSTSLNSAGWAESRIARGNIADEVAGLKSQPGGEILAHGGAAFAQALSRRGLIDEYRLVIRPVALGAGLRLFTDLPAPLRLELVEARTDPDGTAIHVYQPTGHNPAATMREEQP